ncbi:heparinase II/III family protein [Methylocystis heyeri]|uniref:Heparinase n=1 Tax=Methylocystis heyeri TaxID=391905 RepID=A0A6B8K9U0_9HYPH|nr:heparinase II/III family protein [Methylocystis heyeri]QGM44619.1 heparinase [Methylocystis heyeri]
MQEQLRMLLRTAALAAEAVAARAAAPYQAAQGLRIKQPTRLRIAPDDIRTADATVAEEIYNGYFSFDGKVVNARGRSPFLLDPPSAAWRRSLTGFTWLRHLHVSDMRLARENARALVAEFIELGPISQRDPASEPAVAARRTLSFLAHSPLLLDGAEPEFYDSFMAALTQAAKSLSQALLQGRARAHDRFLCALALLEFAICADADAQLQSRITRLLMQELERQILADGGHISRNPRILLELLLDLLPLRQLYAARGLNPPKALLGAIDRMIPILRLLQHGDGSLALFNGMDATAPGKLAAIFMHEAPDPTPLDALESGYRRLSARDSLVIVDAGGSPPKEFSRAAHAGALAFEFSLGAERVVVNCGSPGVQHEFARESARLSAAHSTLVLDERCNCQIAPLSDRKSAGLIVAGPGEVRAERRRSSSGEVLELAHEGYARQFGMIHQRTLALTDDGRRFIGEERLIGTPSPAPFSPREFALRFHLHPAVRAEKAEERKIVLTLPSGALLLFEASHFSPQIEESLFFAAHEGPRKTAQIVISGPASQKMRLRWTFRRIEQFERGEEGAQVSAP